MDTEINKNNVKFCLSSFQWKCIHTLLPKIQLPPLRHHAMVSFILNICYLLDLDLAQLLPQNHWIPVMGDFVLDEGNNWWFCTKDQTGNLIKLAVNDETLEILKCWRIHLGLPPLPRPNEKIPLIPKMKGTKPFTYAPTLKRHIVPYLNYIADQLRQQVDLLLEAEFLLEVTYQWLKRSK